MSGKNPKKNSPPLYLFLFAVYPVLFLYTYNIAEVQFKHTILPMLFSVIFTALLWGVSCLILKNRDKSAAGAAIFIILFFLYGHIFGQLELLGLGLDIPIARHYFIIPLFLLIGSLLFCMIGRAKRDFGKVNYLLNGAALFLVLFNIFNIVHYEIKKNRFVHNFTGDFREVPITRENAEALKEKKLPDIYYIILDEYAAPGTIKRLYNYDNRPFTQYLEQSGFYIAGRSKTKYKFTGESLASSLNMEYLKKGDQHYALIRNNRVMSFLKNAGYRIITFPVYSTVVFNKSDEVFDYSGLKGSNGLNRFYVALLETTMLKFLCEWEVTEKNVVQYTHEKILFIFDELEKLAASKGPKFIYAHIESPHSPFVFDRDGGPVAPAHMYDVLNKKYYLDQYVFINKKVKRLVEVLLNKSSTPPVIVIQSDHGPRGTEDFYPYRVVLDVGDEWKNILNAYYLPGGGRDELYPSISPYNTFRLIFNRYFNTRYPLLKD
ncbi:sulfatase-like hydrolase/transferase [Acidobacteriota bacterium]